MSTWFSADLGDGVAAYNPSNQIQEVFMPLFAAAGCPKDMAVFSRYDLEKNVVTAYFTPSAHLVGKVFKAVPCEKPSSDGIGLLVGEAGSWDIFFPERNRL